MKKLYVSAWSILAIGVLFKIIHYPGAAFLPLLGTILLTIYSLLYLIKNYKTDTAGIFFHFATTAITAYLVFRLNFWEVALPMFRLAFILGAIAIVAGITSIKKQNYSKPKLLLLSFYFVFMIAISFVHSDSIFYLFNMRVLNNTESEESMFHYITYDKYSWFLYLHGKYQEAERYNKLAEKAINEYLNSNFAPDEALEYKEIIKQHKEMLQKAINAE